LLLQFVEQLNQAHELLEKNNKENENSVVQW